MKKLFPLFMAIFLLFVVTVPEIAFAEDVPKATETNTISGNLFDKTKQEDFENKYYEIDTALHKDDEKGAFSKAWGYMFGDDSVGKDIQRKINGVGQWIVSLMFQLNVWLTKILLFVVEQSFSLDIINSIADKLGEAMQNIAGIGSDAKFGSQGLFPAIIKMTSIFSVFYFIYLFFVKRQMTKGISELFKVVCVIAGILVYIANAPTILKGMNTISSEISLQVLSKSTGTIEGNPGQSKEAAVTNVKKQMWDLMIERPYLYLQYGRDSKDKIGEERIKKLLDTQPGEDRTKIVSDDVKDNKNFMMTNDSVGERMIFTFMYYIVNTFAGAPTAVICLMIICCQLLFMIMSIIGPIAMAFALLPKNRSVLISWAEQWLKPLAAKIFLSLIVIILFSIAGMLYKLPEAGTSGYIMTMILQILVFVLCYIFRDNIKAAFKRSKVAYNTVTNLEHMAGKTKDGYNRTVDGIHTGFEKAKDMFWDSTPIDMDDDSSRHTADDTGARQATLDDEKATVGSEEEEEKQQYASIGKDADEDKKVSLGKDSHVEGQRHDEVHADREEQEKATMGDDVVADTEREETEEYREDQEEVHPDNLASLEGIDEEEKQSPELSEVKGMDQQEQDDPSEYENQEREGSAEELTKIGESEVSSKQENPELENVDIPDQIEQDDPSQYETEHNEGSGEELVTIEGLEAGSPQNNPELSEVEVASQVEQDDPSKYEGELAETGGNEKDSQQEYAEFSEISTPGQLEQDNVSGHENELVIGESGDLAGMGASTVVGNNSTKGSSINSFDTASPSGIDANTESNGIGAIQEVHIESSGDLATTSPDSLVSSGSIPGQSMNGNSPVDQKITGQSIEGGQEIRERGSSQDVAQVAEAKLQRNEESSQTVKVNSVIESAQEEVAASEEMMVDATQERIELETVVEENKVETK
ncbi:TPA: type IV secretion system protein [Bacillus cereus]|nr:type IV secretion system protein [Bacillus cereus]